MTTHEGSNLANSWGKVAIKGERRAIRIYDSAVIFKLVRSDEAPKFLHLHVHQEYVEIIRNGWLQGWQEYPYIVKFAQLRSNEEYRLYNARWGHNNEDWNMETAEEAIAPTKEQQQQPS